MWPDLRGLPPFFISKCVSALTFHCRHCRLLTCCTSLKLKTVPSVSVCTKSVFTAGCVSLVPRSRPAFRPHFTVLQVMERWAGPGNEARSCSFKNWLTGSISMCPMLFFLVLVHKFLVFLLSSIFQCWPFWRASSGQWRKLTMSLQCFTSRWVFPLLLLLYVGEGKVLLAKL